MKKNIPHVSRRVIGKLNIFDLHGKIQNNLLSGIHSYIENYIKECCLSNVVINMQSIECADFGGYHSILEIMETPKKAAIYAEKDQSIEKYLTEKQIKRIQVCTSNDEIVCHFGKELIEKDKLIEFSERRKTKRFNTALSATINFIDPNEKIIKTQAIITNMSERGIFVEFFNMTEQLVIQNFDYFKKTKVHILLNKNEKNILSEYYGKILRMEFTGTQVGLAIEFI